MQLLDGCGYWLDGCGYRLDKCGHLLDVCGYWLNGFMDGVGIVDSVSVGGDSFFLCSHYVRFNLGACQLVEFVMVDPGERGVEVLGLVDTLPRGKSPLLREWILLEGIHDVLSVVDWGSVSSAGSLGFVVEPFLSGAHLI